MSIEYQVNAWVYCDNCPNWETVSGMKLDTFKKRLRKKGWIVGRVTLCPACRKLRNEKKED